MPLSDQSNSMPDPDPAVVLTTTLTALVRGVNGKAAIELEALHGEVKVSLLPRNGSTRDKVSLVALQDAINQLLDAGGGR